MREDVGIALLGLGTVGSALVRLLEDHGPLVRKRAGTTLRLVGVAVRRPRAVRSVRVAKRLLTTRADTLAVHPDADVVVELIGGIEPARKLVLAAIEAGKDVVTANKALLAEHGEEIFRAAERRGVHVGFEAAVAGGIPIIRTLRDALAGDRNREVLGIVNGTSNSILSAMTERGIAFADALRDAQAAGLAEADPTLDVNGTDSAHKLALLVTLAFGVRCPLAAIHREGIQDITPSDIAFARELGYVIKLLAIAKDHGKDVEARVHPTMIRDRHLLADVRGATNAVQIGGEALGPTLYVGPGAGGAPTATSVLGDLLGISRLRRTDAPPKAPLGIPHRSLRRVRIRPIGAIESEYYLRFQVVDRPGVLGAIAGALGRSGISIASVIQPERGRRSSVPIVIRTHEARESRLRRALLAVRSLRAVRARPMVLRIEDRL